MMIDDLVRGSIDMHLHQGPDLTMPTRSDALETARQARAMGMRAIVLKNQNCYFGRSRSTKKCPLFHANKILGSNLSKIG